MLRIYRRLFRLKCTYVLRNSKTKLILMHIWFKTHPFTSRPTASGNIYLHIHTITDAIISYKKAAHIIRTDICDVHRRKGTV